MCGEIDPLSFIILQAEAVNPRLKKLCHFLLEYRLPQCANIDWAEVQCAAKVGVTWRDMEMSLPDGTKANW